MKKLDIFSISFYEFSCHDSLTDRILSLVKQESWQKNTANHVTNHDLFYDSELFDWFDNCIESVKTNIGLSKEISLPITSCWANKTSKMEAHHTHHHSNSFMSGIFYLTSHDSAPTFFTYPNYWLQKFADYKFKTPIGDIQNKIYPKKSTLVLFPSHILHSVIGMKDNADRYTIAFNTFLNGEIDDGSMRCRLNLRAKSVREIINET